MRFFDLSQPVFGDCPNCPAHPPVEVRLAADHPKDGWHLERFTTASHTGTHLDAPRARQPGKTMRCDYARSSWTASGSERSRTPVA